jgi:hypothetical protein
VGGPGVRVSAGVADGSGVGMGVPGGVVAVGEGVGVMETTTGNVTTGSGAIWNRTIPAA